MKINRIGTIIHSKTPGLSRKEGSNINGPTLMRVPDWVKDPLGRYYLYFAHHKGTYIRIAGRNLSADQLAMSSARQIPRKICLCERNPAESINIIFFTNSRSLSTKFNAIIPPIDNLTK